MKIIIYLNFPFLESFMEVSSRAESLSTKLNDLKVLEEEFKRILNKLAENEANLSSNKESLEGKLKAAEEECKRGGIRLKSLEDNLENCLKEEQEIKKELEGY